MTEHLNTQIPAGATAGDNAATGSESTVAAPKKNRKKLIAILLTGALVAAGAITAVTLNVIDNNRTTAYDAHVVEANALVDEITELQTEIPEATYVYVKELESFTGDHVTAVTTISKVSDKLVVTETLKPVVDSAAELAENDDVAGENSATELVERVDAQFAEAQDFIEVHDVVIPEALLSSEELGARPTDEQLAAAEEAVAENTSTRDELVEIRDEYVALMTELDDRVISDGALLVDPATEALANVDEFTAGWDKASDDARKKLTDATVKLETALDEHVSGKLAKPAEDAADTVVAADSDEELVPLVTDLLSYEHQVAVNSAVEHQLATNLRVAFVDFIAANNAVKKSHDEAVKAAKAEADRIATEAAAAAAAAQPQWSPPAQQPQWQNPAPQQPQWQPPAPPPSNGGGGGGDLNGGHLGSGGNFIPACVTNGTCVGTGTCPPGMNCAV